MSLFNTCHALQVQSCEFLPASLAKHKVRMSLLSRLSSTSRSSSPSSQAVVSEDSGVIFTSVVRKRLVRPGTRAKPGAWAQRQLELHASPLALLWFEPNARSEDTAAELWQRLPRGTLPLTAAARVEPHPGSAPNHRRQLMVHQGEGGDGSTCEHPSAVLRVECATADERDAWVDAIGRALTARAATATAATDGAVAALYEAFPDVETPLIAEVLHPNSNPNPNPNPNPNANPGAHQVLQACGGDSVAALDRLLEMMRTRELGPLKECVRIVSRVIARRAVVSRARPSRPRSKAVLTPHKA